MGLGVDSIPRFRCGTLARLADPMRWIREGFSRLRNSGPGLVTKRPRLNHYGSWESA